MPEGREFVTVEIDGTLSTASTDQFVAPHALDIVGFSAVVGTAPTGADLILDLEVNGTDIYGAAEADGPDAGTSPDDNRLTIKAGETEAKELRVTNVRLNEGDNLVVKVAQVGSTVAGANLDLSVEYVAV